MADTAQAGAREADLEAGAGEADLEAGAREADLEAGAREADLSWEEYFMALACLTARRRSKDNQFGSLLLSEDYRVVGLGWSNSKGKKDDPNDYVMHSEDKAVMHRSNASLQHGKMYTTMYPRASSTKMLIQSGITHLVYLCKGDKYHGEESMKASDIMVKKATPRVFFSEFVGKKEGVELKFPDADPDADANERTGLSDEEYFMYVASLAAKRTKDPKTQVGACVVKPGRDGSTTDAKVVGISYNGMPGGDDSLHWKKGTVKNSAQSKDSYVVHAEVNAILFCSTADLNGCKIYVTHSPCIECAKAIFESGITEVRYLEVYRGGEGITFLHTKGINCTIFKGKTQKLTINFKKEKENLEKLEKE